MPVPRPQPGEFLVRVGACGVCGHDALARRGELAATPGDVLGHEIAGTVVAAGSDDLEEWVGRRVALVQRRPCGQCPDCERGITSQCRRGPGFYGDDIPGGYSEYVTADPLNAVGVPDTITDEVAAIASCGIGTGLHALHKAQVLPGDVVVITGAGGGVGFNAVRTAHALGLRVIATTSDEAKVAAITDAGAEHTLVRPDARAIRASAAAMDRPRGADAVIEVTGGPTFRTSLRSLAPQGRLVLVGNTVPADLELDPGLTIIKELQVIGSAHATRADLQEVIDMIASEKLVPSPPRALPLGSAADAHSALDDRTATGRTVLVP
ncbi:zinc-binding dehydrogenase [Rhodococcus sp. T7]|uniref:zinc-binding dehydrogenase n=1 Tax=Rhodococcus sp. T7 TaxID=627444 RepID=UPI00135A21B2|nr:zinc-binding dehydrogenase [Rhodococcus sp. T7]